MGRVGSLQLPERTVDAHHLESSALELFEVPPWATADVHTSDAIIMGQYEGNMVATGNVEITASGHATGNIETDSLEISKGAFFNGNVVKMQGGAEAVADRRSIGPALVEAKHADKKPA